MNHASDDLNAESEGSDRQSAERMALAFLESGQDIDLILRRLHAEIAAFNGWAPPSGDAGMLLATLAAVHPAALTVDIGTALAEVIRQGDLTRTRQPTVDEAFRLLALLIATPAHSIIPDLVQAVLHVPGLNPRWYRNAISLLQALSDWRAETLDLLALLEAAEQLERPEATALFHAVIGPLLLADPARADLQFVERIWAITGDGYEARYQIASLAEHDETRAAVRTWAKRVSANWFPLRAIWRRLFRGRALRVLCVQNISDGQGDEMIRTGPLLQALLDDEPDTQITLITDRAYLYGHPRIETISFDEPERIGATLNQPFDALIEFFEPHVRHINHDVNLAYALANWRAKFSPSFVLQADKGLNQFIYTSVQIGGLEWAEALQFNEMRYGSVYDPMLRLIVELGLPLRFGEQPARSEPVLAGQRWPEADSAWDAVTSENVERRPIAMLNPFGGSAMLKGFVHQKFDDLARAIRALIDEGYFVVVCPSGTPWGSSALIDDVLGRLTNELRRQISIAPDPSLRAVETRESDGAHQETTHPSRMIRHFISFVARSDLIVTVEGWMAHAAYQLGKPYRLILMPESGDRSWQPWGRSRGQRWWLFEADAKLDRPPLPERPRNDAWLALLARITDPAWQALLREIERSKDQAIRNAAIHALGRIGDSSVVPHLYTLLSDGSCQTRSIAADVLLNFHRDSLSGASAPSAAVLEAFRLIGARPFTDWSALTAQGRTALPSLNAALHGDEAIMRRESAIVLEHLSRANASEPVDLAVGVSAETRNQERG